jgi:hypothetical protein
MYQEIESIYSKRSEEKERLLHDITMLVSHLKYNDWYKIESCLRKILDLPQANKIKILNDPTFHNFISKLNSQIINSFETKNEIIFDRTLIDYVNLLLVSISHFSSNLIEFQQVEFTFNENALIPGTDFLIYRDNLEPHKYLPLPKCDGIKIINKQIDPFFSETKVYNTEYDFEIESWVEKLNETLLLIKLNPYCNALVTNFVNFIFPLKQKVAEIDFSFSSKNLPNTVFKNMESSAYLFGESLVHEGDHLFFYALEDIYSFWKKNANYHQEIYFSPWRKDPRPLEGILRGLSAFARVCMYYSTLIENVKSTEISIIGRLLLLKINQCYDAVNTLITSEQLSEIGLELVLEINTILEEIDFKVAGLSDYVLWKEIAVNSINEKKDSWNTLNNIYKK